MALLSILSDLHREFAPFQPSARRADVIVLAGDIDHGVRGVEWARDAFPDLPIVYVAGNHEYYGEAIPHLTDKLRTRAADLAVRFLENDVVDIAGIRFIGCTLWTDLKLLGPGPWVADEVARGLADFRAIRVSPEFRRLHPQDTTVWHNRSRVWLQGQPSASPTPTVVVTHHAPSLHSIAPTYRESPVSAGFASNLDALVAASGATLWVHGHTHHSQDYRVGATRVLSNQRGYPAEPNTGFDPDLLVAVP